MDHLVGLFDPRPDDSSVLTTALPPEVFVRRWPIFDFSNYFTGYIQSLFSVLVAPGTGFSRLMTSIFWQNEWWTLITAGTVMMTERLQQRHRKEIFRNQFGKSQRVCLGFSELGIWQFKSDQSFSQVSVVWCVICHLMPIALDVIPSWPLFINRVGWNSRVKSCMVEKHVETLADGCAVWIIMTFYMFLSKKLLLSGFTVCFCVF